VAGGDAVGADLAGGDEELVELEVVVAEGAGDGRASSEILRYEGHDDVGFEAGLLVDYVVGDVELLGNVAGVIDIVDGTAAALDGLGHALVSSEAALIPKLQGEADEGVALCAQECGDGGGVDSSGHGDGDGLPTGLGRGAHCWLLGSLFLYLLSSIFAFDGQPGMRWPPTPLGVGVLKSRLFSSLRSLMPVKYSFKWLTGKYQIQNELRLKRTKPR
jgi:hypothetical protein